ncbi:flavin reductase [Halioxenophilus aromaticivorans]|uniref:Flavin reductase family protein n=1 Tax=Halioxenophilus aromaticivorans TaxID=1306992 RepID=A0AAV3U6U7_9ALTE
MNQAPFDPRDFRRTLGQFPTGVTIVTTLTADGQAIGCTASSFNSVSVDPPLVLWSIDKSSFSCPIFTEAKHFAVNVLSRDQMDLSNKFAGRGEDKFAGVDYRRGLGDAPLFDHCSAQFECQTWQVYEGGDHFIIVGEVLSYIRNEAKLPLVFTQGGYAVAMQHPAGTHREIQAHRSDFLSNYFLYLLRSAYTCYSSKLYPLLSEHYQVSPEEWRTLTVMAQTPNINLQQLANDTAQPLAQSEETVNWMLSKGWVTFCCADSQVTITDSGRALCEQLLNLAQEHEKEILNHVGIDHAEQLKSDLKTICDALA